MVSGWRYRGLSVLGTVGLTVVAVASANHPVVQRAAQVLPVYEQLPATTLPEAELGLALATTVVAFTVALLPQFKPRPRSLFGTVVQTEIRVLTGAFALAAIGYFDYTYRLPRATLVLTTAALLAGLPLWFVVIRREPGNGSGRAIVVGDDANAISEVSDAASVPVLGYVAPPLSSTGGPSIDDPPTRFDGGTVVGPDGSAEVVDGRSAVETSPDATDDESPTSAGDPTTADVNLDRLGGLARLDSVLVENDVDTVLLGFSATNRPEFFGTLDACYDNGVAAKVPRDHASNVPTVEERREDVVTNRERRANVVEVDLKPWDWQDYVLKRAFDVGVALVGLLLALPVMGVVAAAIARETPGPILARQTRTGPFGETVTVYSFRTRVASDGDEPATGIGGVDGKPRVTRVGRLLEATHLENLPALWSILVGELSVVGPRPRLFGREPEEMNPGRGRPHCFVKPGLIGLAAIDDAGEDPAERSRLAVEYVRRQSLRTDGKILVRHLAEVVRDALSFLASAFSR